MIVSKNDTKKNRAPHISRILAKCGAFQVSTSGLPLHAHDLGQRVDHIHQVFPRLQESIDL
jgi:hypothetical protein